MTESSLQCAIIKWAATMESHYPELRWLHHVPNGGKRDSAVGALMKREGVKTGILDLALDVARGGYHGFRCELKRPGSSQKPTKEQAEYMGFLEGQGYYVFWTNSFDEFKGRLINYLEGDTP